MKEWVAAFAVFIVIFSIGFTFFVSDQIHESEDETQGFNANVAQGTVSLCIVRPFILPPFGCATSINQSTLIENNTYFCQLPRNDTYGNDLIYLYDPPLTQPGLEFSVSESGLMRINGIDSSVGPYSSSIVGITNVSACSQNGSRYFSFSILDINDPPYLVGNVPSKNLQPGIKASVFYLDDYFDDYEGDELSYTAYGYSNFYVYINPTTSEVILGNPDDNCEEDAIYFRARDPGNLTADSNMVTLKSLCQTEVDTSSGGGSGGGPNSCEPEWKCNSWSQCYPNETQSRNCVDLNGCDLNNLRRTFVQRCEYIATCFDGIQNQDETGIDCGGSCPTCEQKPSCYDGILNQGEVDIDCGGPCEACVITPTCDDGRKNQGEVGIDCGGPCPACKDLNVPALINDEQASIWTSVLITILVIVILVIVYLIFRKEILSLHAKFTWWLTRKRRKQVILSDKDRDEILKALEKIEQNFALRRKSGFNTSDKFMQKLLGSIRYYFMKTTSLPLEFKSEDLTLKIEKRILNESLRSVFKLLFKKLEFLETHKLDVSKQHVAMLIEELRQLVISTSNAVSEPYALVGREMRVKGDPLEKMVILIHNALLALQFNEVETAKSRYFSLLGYYQKLDENQKALIYDDVTRIYFYIKYQVSVS